MPLLTITGAAAGEARNLISALPASGSFDTLAMPAENTVIFCKLGRQLPDDIDAGNGFSSLIC